ncbi:MAG: hypothetical protein ACE5I5_20335 [Candidatus Heimdallarchaeota archaeon]
MVSKRNTHTPDAVKRDVEQFFTDSNHWAYQYGDPTPDCNPNSPYHRKQIEVIFESKYEHWKVNTAVDKLIEEDFLRLIKTKVAHFVVRSDIRYYTREVKRRCKIIERYASPTITRAYGQWCEKLVEYMFKLNGFEILEREENKFQGKEWTKTKENLDFIVGKDYIAYGVEVKNTLPYMEIDEFSNKLEMCKYLGLIPLWILRNAPEVQFNTMKANSGFILPFKSQIYPYGQEPLTKEIWQKMRLPVTVKAEMPQKIVKSLNWFHNQNISGFGL